MSDLRTILERGVGGATPPPDGFERMLRRRDRKHRNQRIGAGALAIILALVSFVALTRVFRTAERPADQPTPGPQGIFSEVGGWIAYGNDEGIWAVNPTPGSTSDRVQLSERPGYAVAWSNEGSKLLIAGESTDTAGDRGTDFDLFFLNADGTETRLTWNPRSGRSGSISPDGSKVVYAANLPGEEWRSGIYLVDADGGSRRLLLEAGSRTYPDGTYDTAVFQPTFSPDGTQIAYFDGMGDWGNSLRVMNADGSDVRALINQEFGHVDDLAWSSDGSLLAFDERFGGGIWIVGVDGSGLTEVVPNGSAPRRSPTDSRLVFQSAGGMWVIDADGSGLRQVAPVGRDPVWSPNGSRIAYVDEGSLYIADLNRTHVWMLGTLEPPRDRPTPMVWIPAPPSASGGE